MRAYLITFLVGGLVGVLYGLLNVRSPAPPIIALVGLLGILLGEQLPPLVKRLAQGAPLTMAAVKETCAEHVFGALPGQRAAGQAPPPRAPDHLT